MDQALGTAVFAGMIGVTFFGIFFTPVFFSIIMKIFGGRAKRRVDKSDKEDELPWPEEPDEQLVGERE
jgi:hydrophobic/amphiphilic exporter-1 (mainly G- bacteria), HAE1 family